MELFRDINGYEGKYQISNLGRVKSLNYNKTKQEKILKPIKNKKGYLSVDLYSKSGFKIKRIHRLVAEAFIPNPENKEQVNHKDGNKQNNHVDNLEWVTATENMKHAFKTGLQKPNVMCISSCEESYYRKLTQKEVDYIRNTYKKGSKKFGSVSLGKQFNVSHNCILAIVNNKSWKKVI